MKRQELKKIFKLIIIIVISFIILQLFVLVFKTKHYVSYQINNKETFLVEEIYIDNEYHFKITWNNLVFSYKDTNTYNKSKKVLNNIKYYQKDHIFCIYPELNNANITCYKDNVLVSYSYIKDEIKDFTNSLNKKYLKWKKEDNIIKTIDQVNVVTNNIDKKTNIYLWKYNGFYLINSKKLKYINILNNDMYKNNLGILVDKYYLFPNYDSKYEYNFLYVLNTKNSKVQKINLKDSTSKNIYYSGIVNNKLYLFDKDNLIEYEINPEKKKIKEIGNIKEGGIIYQNNAFKYLNIYDFKEKEITFNDLELSEYFDDINYDYIYKYKNSYYYLFDNNLYLYDDITNINILLLNDIENPVIAKDDIYYIKDNYLYLYNINSDIKEILSYNELRFNKDNRVIVYKK